MYVIIQINIDCKEVSWMWRDIFYVLGIFRQHLPVLNVPPEREICHLPSVDVLVVVKISFQKELPEWSHCGFSRKAISLRQGSSADHTVTAGSQITDWWCQTLFQRSSSSYHPSMQPAQELPGYPERAFDRNQNTSYNEVRWSKEGNVDSPVQNLGCGTGDGCMCGKVLYAWK